MTHYATLFSDPINVSGTTAEIWGPALAMLDNGRTVVAWTEDGNEAVWLRFYDADGEAEGQQIAVTPEGERGNRPSIAVQNDGSLVVTYTALPTGSSSAISARVFTGDGTALGPPTQMFTDPGRVAISPETIALSNGSVLTIFTAYDSDRFGVYAQLADGSGSPTSSAWLVNQTTSGFQSAGVPVELDDGGFAVTWKSRDVDGSFYAVMVRTYDADGTPRGGEARVNQFSSWSQTSPDITVLSDGRFVVSWQSDTQDGSGDGVYARIYSASGIPQGSEFRVNSTTQYDQNTVSIAATPDGGFVVVWMNVQNGDGDRTDIRLQRFDVDGNAVGNETVLADSPAGVHLSPEIAVGDDGIVSVIWAHTVQNSLISTVFLATSGLQSDGTGGNDYLMGTSAADLLSGNDGEDEIRGGRGDDTLFGGDNIDLLVGNSGDDTISGGKGSDVLKGHNGHDILNGDGWGDKMWGGNGDDQLFGATGKDIMYGGNGSDILFGGEDNDIMEGNSGRDELHGDDGDDRLKGHNSDDTLFGGAGDDKLLGGNGNDIVSGGAGDDQLFGGNHADYFEFRVGDDVDTIVDFQNNSDEIRIQAAFNPGNLNNGAFLAQFGSIVNGNAVLDLGNGDILIVEGVSTIGMIGNDLEFI